jgi:DNA-binding HxlR family transcriptional regulator
MRKLSSKNHENELIIHANCGMAYTLDLIGGRWKPSILYRLLLTGSMRYTEIRKSLPDVSERILSLQLKQLEADGLISKMVFHEVPPKVEYKLSEKGFSMKPVLELLSDWGDVHRPKKDDAPNDI